MSQERGSCRLLIPRGLAAPHYLEIGYLMAQLNAIPFPDSYAPFGDVPSLAVPLCDEPSADFGESYPHGMKFLIARQKNRPA